MSLTPTHRDPREAIVSRETSDKLAVFVELLLRWNGRINLVARADAATIWTRHVADSLQLVPLIRQEDKSAIDIGTGAGFPGLVVAIATATSFHLVESDGRKAAFLREAVRLTGVMATIHATRAENLKIPPVDVVTARAVARLPALLGLATRFLSPCGHCLFPKGKTAEDELVEARRHWHMTYKVIASQTDPGGCILDIREITRVQP